MRIDIKALSINEAFKGRRFKTDKHKKYVRDVIRLLRPLEVPSGELTLKIRYGVSSNASDVDNLLKCLIDCLQLKYGFNDKMIRRIEAEKELVKKGSEYIDFTLEKYFELGIAITSD